MKFTVKLADIQSAVSLASTAVSDHAILPILNNILISTEADSLSISGTDVEKYAKAKCTAEILQSGECLVPAKTLQAILSKIQEESLTVTLDSNKLKIVAGSLKLSIPHLPRGTFPVLEQPKFDSGFSTDTETLKSIIKNTLFATSKDTAKQILNGININDKYISATDGYRLSHMNHTYPITKSIIIPNQALKALLTIIPTSETINIEISEAVIQFSTETCIFQSKLIAGTFPNIEPLLTKEGYMSFVLNTKELINSLELSLILSQTLEAQYVLFKYANKTLNVTTHDDSINKPLATSDIDTEFSIAYNAKYILDYLKIIPDETVTIFLKDEQSAGHLTPNSPLASYVIMPYRV